MALTEKQLESQRRYRTANKDVLRERQRTYQRANVEARRLLNKNWIINNRARYNASKARYRFKLKCEVMRLYANPVKCVRCGFSVIDGLVLDHVNNDGAKHRRESGISSRGNPGGLRIYEHIRKNGKIDGLQVLCANCNTIKQLRHWRANSIKDPVLLAEIEALYEDTDTGQ